MALDEEFIAEIGTAVDAEVAVVNEELHEATPEEEGTDSSDLTEEKVTKEVVKEETQEEVQGEVQEEQGEQEEIQEEDELQGKEKEKQDKVKLVPVSDEILTRAVRAGLTIAEARTFPDNESLSRICEVWERGARDASKEEEVEKEDPLKIFDNLDENEAFEPEVIKFLGTLADEIRSQRDEIKTLRSGQDQFSQVNQAGAAREVEQWFDGQVTNLGEDFQEVLGIGSHSSLDRGSSQFEKREAIANQMAVMLAGYSQLGKSIPPREEVFAKAVKLELGDEYQRIQERKLQGKLKKRSGQHLQRGGKKGHKTTNESPEEQAAKLLDEKYFKK